MPNILTIILAVLIGYLIGAIPFGFIYLKLFKGVDVRKVASGRTGGTNSYRAGGFKIGMLTGLSDVLKGAAAVLVARAVLGGSAAPEMMPWVASLAGVFSVIGHNWSIYIGFAGGAGTTPNMGWSAAIWPFLVLVNIVVGALSLTFIGMASVASLMVAFIIPTTFAILYFLGVPGFSESPAYIIGGLVTAFIVASSLIPNIKRIFAGTERVVGPRAKRMAKKQSG